MMQMCARRALAQQSCHVKAAAMLRAAIMQMHAIITGQRDKLPRVGGVRRAPGAIMQHEVFTRSDQRVGHRLQRRNANSTSDEHVACRGRIETEVVPR